MANEQSEELTNLGFQQDKAKRGLVSYTIGTFAVLLFISVGVIVILVKEVRVSEKEAQAREKECRKELKETHDAYNKALLEMVKGADKLQKKIDTLVNKTL